MRSQSTNGRSFPQARNPQQAARVIALARQHSTIRTPERVGAESMAIVDRRHARSRPWWRRLRSRFARIYYSPVDWMAFVGALVWIGATAFMSWVLWEMALWLGAEHWTW